MPPPMSSQSFLCVGLAARSRGNHARGTDTVRPSSSTTVNEWSAHDTSTASVSLLSTKVGIPLLQEEFPIIQHEVSNDGQFVASKTTIRRERHRFEPELRITPSVCHVNVWWLTILQTVEVEPVALHPQERRHNLSLPLVNTFREVAALSVRLTCCVSAAAAHSRTSRRRLQTLVVRLHPTITIRRYHCRLMSVGGLNTAPLCRHKTRSRK